MGFRINRVYTRSGDKGETGLVGGKRVGKNDLRVEAYGEIDELNSWLGLIKEKLSPPLSELKELLEFLQQELFDLGSELATPPSAEYQGMIKVTSAHVARLEKACDYYGDGLEELTSFILPGGSECAALFHIARTVCRRGERVLVTLIDDSAEDPEMKISPELLQYVNRLSDLLFILARRALKEEGKSAPLWEKGGKKIPGFLAD